MNKEWMDLVDAQLRMLDEEVKDKRRKGDEVTQGCETITNFPKNPPPPGVSYSKNFARFHKHGRFAVQVRG